MFVFKPTKQTYSDPVSATFLPGIPFGRERARGDICLLHTGFSGSKVFLNSIILREAILNSKEYLEEALDIKIIDKLAKNEQAIQKAKKPKKDAKEAELYIAEEIVLPTEEATEPATEQVTEQVEPEPENLPISDESDLEEPADISVEPAEPTQETAEEE